jgi:hypothetical protein
MVVAVLGMSVGYGTYEGKIKWLYKDIEVHESSQH